MQSAPWDPEGVEPLLDPEGGLVDAGAAHGLDLRAHYKQLVRIRSLDLKLSRLGLPMWASAAGEEAPQVSLAAIARPGEWIHLGPRDVGCALARGLAPDEIVRQLLGHPSSSLPGCGVPGTVAAPKLHVAPATANLGLHLALASGRARAQLLMGRGGATFASIGEGSTTLGVVHEAIVLAVQGNLPLVVVCKSQVWPDGAPSEAGIFGDNVAERMRAKGCFTNRADGADPVGVHRAIEAAAERARTGRGPCLVEVIVTPMHRNPPAERDPIERLRRHLDTTGKWSQTFQDVIEAEIRTAVDRTVAELRGQNGEPKRGKKS
jgi:TPP-dependent pyruvate/acetoin dehydrogenase alpha subunit